jgi:hypothetical protein
VYTQSVPAVEHVIVSDGPDRDLADLLAKDLWRRPLKTRSLVVDQLPQHLDGPVDYGSRARNRGLELASGEYIAYLDDDNAYRPKHLQQLAEALELSGADFAYSQMLTHPANSIVGLPQPTYGGIDTSLLMHRAGVPERFGMWPLPDELIGDKHAPDWGVVARWLDNGATWIHVAEVSVDYYVGG